MPAWERKFSDEQQDAVVDAYLDRGIRPAKRVSELAAAGELTFRGQQLEPFDIGINTIRDYARQRKRRRHGKVQSKLSEVPHRDAIEAMRKRLVNLCDAEITYAEKKRNGTLQVEYLRQMSRALLELARLPAPSDPGAVTPDTRDPETGKQYGARGAMVAGPLLRAHRSNGTPEARTAAKPPNLHQLQTDTSDTSQAAHQPHASTEPNATV